MRINYYRVLGQAEEISQNAKELKRCVEMLEIMEESSVSAWQGEAANEFRNKLSLLRQNINNTSMEIDNVASRIRSCAERIRQEDESAAQRAEMLKKI